MAYKTVADVKDSISGILSGINLNNVVNLNMALERSAREMASLISIPESSAKTTINLYNGVTDYAAPTDIFGASLVDFRPQSIDRYLNDYVSRKPIAIFDRTKAYIENGYELAFEFVKGVGRMRIASTRPTPNVVLDTMSDDTGWTATGSASGLVEDETVYYDSPASLRFTLTGSSTGTLTKAVSQVDVSEYEDVCVGFLAMRTPSIANLTSIAVRVGSSASAYDEVTETDGFLGAWVVDEWLLVAFDFSTATATGTPDWNAIDYLQVRVAHTGTITNFRVGGFWLALPSPHTMYYQTAAIFQVSGSNPSQTITNNSDSVLLNDQALVIYEHLAAKVIAEQQGGTLASGLMQSLMKKLGGNERDYGLIDLYRASNPSQELRMIGSYYD